MDLPGEVAEPGQRLDVVATHYSVFLEINFNKTIKHPHENQLQNHTHEVQKAHGAPVDQLGTEATLKRVESGAQPKERS